MSIVVCESTNSLAVAVGDRGDASGEGRGEARGDLGVVASGDLGGPGSIGEGGPPLIPLDGDLFLLKWN